MIKQVFSESNNQPTQSDNQVSSIDITNKAVRFPVCNHRVAVVLRVADQAFQVFHGHVFLSEDVKCVSRFWSHYVGGCKVNNINLHL